MKHTEQFVQIFSYTCLLDMMRASRIPSTLAVLVLALAAGGNAFAQERKPLRFELLPPAGTIANCIPNGRAEVTVFPKEEINGTDTLQLKASGLVPNIEVTVFLTELAAPPFGAVEYIGDFKTNAAGEGSFRANTIVNEAFASVTVGGTRVRTDLNHVVLWFADPADDDVCFAPNSGPVTPFDGDGNAGATILSSANSLPGAPLP